MTNQKKKTEFAVSKSLNKPELRTAFDAKKRLHIPNFLELESAQLIYETLKSQAQWNLCFNKQGEHVDMNAEDVSQWSPQDRAKLDDIIHAQASQGFQYKYQTIPVYDIVKNQLLPGHIFNDLYHFFNSDAVLNTLREITRISEVNYLDMQATKYSAGDFLNEHNDAVDGKNRLAAYVLNLTPNWRHEWGGALAFNNGPCSESYYPTFNSLNIFTVPQRHLVSSIALFAPASRYALTGWLRV